jgi:tetratricopeptide (TPR) repeat protein
MRPTIPCLLWLSLSGCGGDQVASLPRPGALPPGPLPAALAPALVAPSAGLGLAERIARQQERLRRPERTLADLEQLGTLWVAQARWTHDDGCYKLAERCALALDELAPGSAAALLLRGHVLQSLHRFGEAESVARRLVQQRGILHDHGLLGDVLVDQGRLREAMDSYQRMLDLRPCLQSYARAAHVKQLRGDLRAARELFEMARGAGSPRDAESLAWVETRLGAIDFQLGDLAGAELALQRALAALPGHAPSRFWLGRLRLAQDRRTDAIAELQRAAELHPLPEHLWALADVQHPAASAATEQTLLRDGSSADPRSHALWLCTRGQRLEEALALVREELARRADVFTHDAHAWALHKHGRVTEAWAAAQRALAEGTQDARIYLHAGACALAAGETARGRELLAKARALLPLLLPSEQDELARLHP